MTRYNKLWIQQHSGKMTPRRMSAVLRRIASHIGRSYEDLALTKESRRHDPFRLLVACIISLRTKDEVTDEVAPRLLAEAPTPARMARTAESRIAELIFPAGFYKTKAKTLRSLGFGCWRPATSVPRSSV